MSKNESISDLVQKMIDSVDTVARNISHKVAYQMQQDMLQEAEKIARNYYSYQRGSYTKKDRTYQLYNIYGISLNSIRKNANGYKIDVRLQYNPEDMSHHSNSSLHQGSGSWSSGGGVSEDYIFYDLFYEGKHPWYSGSPVNDGSYKLYPTRGMISPKKAWNRFKNNYDDLYLKKYIDNIVVDEFNNWTN